MLLCEGVSLFRHSVENGYGFMSKPVNIDCVIVSGMSTDRPQVRQIKRANKEESFTQARHRHATGDTTANQKKELVDKRYVFRTDERALAVRLEQLVRLALVATEDGQAPPVLVLTLAGCLDRRLHPPRDVMDAVRNLRINHGHRFAAILLACGTREMALECDEVINGDLYIRSAERGRLWVDKYANKVCQRLQALGANTVWKQDPPKWDVPLRRRSTATALARLQSQELSNSIHSGIKLTREPQAGVNLSGATPMVSDSQFGQALATLAQKQREKTEAAEHAREVEVQAEKLARCFRRNTVTLTDGTLAKVSKGTDALPLPSELEPWDKRSSLNRPSYSAGGRRRSSDRVHNVANLAAETSGFSDRMKVAFSFLP